MGDSQREDDSDRLLLAALDKNLRSVQEALERGADVNAKLDDWERTPLHMRIWDFEIVKFLIENGADVHSKDINGCTPVHNACERGDFETVKLMVEKSVDDISSPDNSGYTPLHYACWNGRSDVAEWLMDNGAEVNAKGDDEETPLHCASGCDRLAVVKLLVSRGANPEMDSPERGTPLHIAAAMDRRDVLEFLVSHRPSLADLKSQSQWEAGKTPFHSACEGGYLEAVQILLNAGASVDMETTQGATPLHLACEENYLEVVWFLVRQCPWLVSEQLE